MNINLKKNGAALNVTVSGRLDTTTAPELEKALSSQLEGIESPTLDFGELAYISSAGLRVLLALQKTMNRQGQMVVTHVNDNTMEVFDVTGFVDVLTIRQ